MPKPTPPLQGPGLTRVDLPEEAVEAMLQEHVARGGNRRDITAEDCEAMLLQAAPAIRKQHDGELRERLEARVLRTPEPTPKQEALMEEFADEMPLWAQLAFVQSEVERMREEARQVIAGMNDG